MLARRKRLEFLLVLAASLALARGVGAEDVRVSYRFPAPVVARTKTFHRLSMPGLTTWGAPGVPALPRRLARVTLPAGRSVEGVLAHPGRRVRLSGLYRIEPGREERSPADGVLPCPSAQQSAVYDSPAPYPSHCLVDHTVGFQRGRAVALISLCPVVYLPRSGEVHYYEEIEVEVRTKAAPGKDGKARRGQGGGEEEIAYAIVTSPKLADAFEPLAALRTASGLPARVVTTDWIYSSYSGLRPDGGEDDATRIRNFITDWYDTHGLQFVLLGGDADGDAICSECEPPIVPARLLQTDALTANPIPSDLYYGCLDGTFDDDRDGIYGEPTDGEGGGDVDLLSEVHVGRAPVDSPLEAENFVAKTLAYEASSGPVLREVLLVGEHLGFGGEYDWGGNLNDQVRHGSSEFITTEGFETSPYRDFFRVRTLYDRDALGRDWSPRSLMDILEMGVHVVNHVGHADISSVMKLTSAEIDSLSGGDFFLGYTQSCYAGAFDNRRTHGAYGADSVIEHLLVGPSGAVAFVANSRRGWASTGAADGPSQRFNRRFWDVVFRQGALRWGEANDRSKEESIADIRANVRARWVAYELNTLGDPSLALKLAGRRGSIGLDRPSYNPGTSANVTVIDADLDTFPDEADVFEINLRATASGDEERVRLTETGVSSGVFQGGVALEEGALVSDAKLQVRVPDTIVARYHDADDGTGSTAQVEATATVAAPLAFVEACPAEGAAGVPYRWSLEAQGGIPPYSYQSEAGYVEEVQSPNFRGLGVRQGWNDDDARWDYALPFEFPFYGRLYETVTVSSNGYLQFGGRGDESDFSSSAEKLIAGTRVAPLWADLVTAGSGDIYIDESIDSVTIRWRGTSYHGGGAINTEAELIADGRIRFGYGTGNNNLSPTIGISAGDGQRYVISALNGSEDLDEAASVEYFPTRLPRSLTVDPDTGEITGIPEEVLSGHASFRVEDSLGQSDRLLCFLVVRPDGLFIAAPAGGDLWLGGKNRDIRWEWSGGVGETVRLDYNTDGSKTEFPHVIAEEWPLDERAYPWSVPLLEASRVRVRVQSREQPDFFTYSDVFSIVGPTLLLLSPNGGERWIVGEDVRVLWESIGDSGAALRIDYNTDGDQDRFPLNLTASAPNSGEFRLTVPETPSATCRLRLRSLAAPSVRAVSGEFFAIRPPSITLSSPNGGECLRAGATTLVTWTSEGNTGDQVILEYNTDGGTDRFPFTVGDGLVPNSGSAVWELPEASADRVRLRIRSADRPSLEDISDGSFALAPRCALRVLVWIPHVAAEEEQVVGVVESLARYEPDAEVTFSSATGPTALLAELARQDTLIVPKQKHGDNVDFALLGNDLAEVLHGFLAGGGAVVVSHQTHDSIAFAPATGLLDLEIVGEGERLCEVSEPLHPVVQGVRPNFSGPRNTGWYRVSGPGIEQLVTVGDEQTVVAARDVGFGRFAFLGFDYYSFNNDASRILANAARVPLPEAGLRLTEPVPGEVRLAGQSTPIRWVARGEARAGRVSLAYNTDGSDTSFPLPIADVEFEGERGNHDWLVPDPPAERPYLAVWLQVRSETLTEHRHAYSEPFYVAHPLVIETRALPPANVGLEYRAEVRVSGGVPPYSFSLAGLPAGLAASESMDLPEGIAILGIPQRECAACEVEFSVEDSVGLSVREFFPLPVFLRRMEIVEPGGGELWLHGSSQEVSWRTFGAVGETVSLSFNTDGSTTSFPFPIAASLAIDAPYVWQLPTINASVCRLRVQSNELPEFQAISEAFSIVGPTIRLRTPNGGECWEPGRRRSILWQSAGNEGSGVRIEYSTDGSVGDFPFLIAENAPDTGEYTWTVPDTPSESCRLRLSFENAPEIADVSDAPFRIHPRCRLDGLLWSPCPVGAGIEEIIRQAVLPREPEFQVESTSTHDPEELAAALANRDVLFVLLMSSCHTLDYATLATSVAPVLQRFVDDGGVTIFCGPGPLNTRFVSRLGVMENLFLAVFSLHELSCRITSFLHPIVREVPLAFQSPPGTFAYRMVGADFEPLVEAREFPVAAAKDDGRGRWVLFGFDFRAPDPAIDRLLSNSVRMEPVREGLRVIAPAPGAVFTAGDPVPIEWAARGERSGPLVISYNTDGSLSDFPLTLDQVEGGPSGGSYLWTAPQPPPGEHFACRLRVAWEDPPRSEAHSEGPFHVVRERLAILTSTLADGYRGAEYRSEVLITGGLPPYTLGYGDLPAGLVLAAPEGNDSVAVVSGRPLVSGTDVAVPLQVRDLLGSVAEGVLRLNIYPSEIEFTESAGGPYLLAGSTHEIGWRVSGYVGETLNIRYNRSGSSVNFPFLIAEEVPVETGAFTWEVPAEEGALRLRISSELAHTSISEPFTVAGPHLAVLSPNGAEVLETGTTRTIIWRSLGNPGARVRIDLNLDGSTDFFPTVVAEEVPDTGALTWKVPSTVSETCRLRVRSVAEPTMLSVSSGTFAIRHRTPVRGLVWIPYSGFDREATRGAIAAATLFEHDFDWTLSRALEPRDVERELEGNDTFLMVLQEPESLVNFKARGRALGPVLENFALRGGTVVVLRQRGGANEFVSATGLLEAAELGTELDVPCRVVSRDHPVVNQVPERFTAPSATSWYDLPGESTEVYAVTETGGHAVVAGRDIGDGRVVLVGFDYRDYNQSSARILANALRRTRAIPRPRFVRGDANGDGVINLPDAVFILGYLFHDGSEPACMDAADVNDSAAPGLGRSPIDLSDAIHLLTWLFSGGPPPSPPSPSYPRAIPESCGVDPQFRDELECASYPPCE